MAHELTFGKDGNENNEFFASVESNAETKAWHKEGETIVKEAGKYATKQEILAGSGLESIGYEKVPVFMDVEGEQVEIYGKAAVRRTDNKSAIGIVGDNFQEIQPSELAEFAEAVIGESGAYFDTGGLLMGGKLMFFSLKLPESIMGGENLNKSLTIASANDGSLATTMLTSFIRPVCWNTLSASMRKNKNKIAIRHTKNWKNKVEEARRVLNITVQHFEELAKSFESLRSESINENYARAFVNTLFPAKGSTDKIPKQTLDVREQVFNLFQSGKGNEGKTKWDLFNGVTEYIDHHTRGRITDKTINRAEEGADIEAEQTFYRVNFGSGSKLRQEAFDLLTA
jgi:phage/plasmid-like protein (TIGR03299 family)